MVGRAEMDNSRSGDLITEEDLADIRASKPEDEAMDPEVLTPFVELLCDSNHNVVARPMKVRMDVPIQQRSPTWRTYCLESHRLEAVFRDKEYRKQEQGLAGSTASFSTFMHEDPDQMAAFMRSWP